jgi:hypothetical protein
MSTFSQGASLHQYNGARIIPVVSAYQIVPVILSLSISDLSSIPVVLSIRRSLWLVAADKINFIKGKRTEEYVAHCFLIKKSAYNFAVTSGTGIAKKSRLQK